ncbi:MAG: type III toxin-antitoxin system ToxN/AbiQ family toxin [Faecalimonas sp.]|nr:type III toxin-antitoxin system ToxN/AbiQ family toxin [Faecalimonas sp.]
MDNIKIYEVDAKYINYLSQFAPHLFLNKQAGQQNERKYIGVVLSVNGMDYFAPLSSFKPKHNSMRDGIDFIKIKNYAVINLNNMFPIAPNTYSYVDISAIKNEKYKELLRAEYRYIKSIQERIRKNALTLYKLWLKDSNKTALGKRCNDFTLLEDACRKYK